MYSVWFGSFFLLFAALFVNKLIYNYNKTIKSIKKQYFFQVYRQLAGGVPSLLLAGGAQPKAKKAPPLSRVDDIYIYTCCFFGFCFY